MNVAQELMALPGFGAAQTAAKARGLWDEGAAAGDDETRVWKVEVEGWNDPEPETTTLTITCAKADLDLRVSRQNPFDHTCGWTITGSEAAP